MKSRMIAFMTAVTSILMFLPMIDTQLAGRETHAFNVSEDAEFLTSGTCGNDLTWKVEMGGKIIISGTGAMERWFAYDDQPWSNFRDHITSVVFESGVTYISSMSFSGCTNLTSITIPESVTEIGMMAFEGCKSLTGVTIPDGVTTIGMNAFQGCETLADITIPESVTKFGGGAFSNTAWLLQRQKEDPLVVANGILIDGSPRTSTVTVPKAVTSIADFAFANCENLSSVRIMDGVTGIGDSVFYGCKNLTGISIPDSVTAIGYSSFSGSFDVTIYCNSGSYAEAYAKKRSIPYKLIGIDDGIPEEFSDPYYFVMGRDNWSFKNATYAVKADGYDFYVPYFSDTDWENLEQIANERIYRYKNGSLRSGGSCYGMSCTAILVSRGLLNPSDFYPGAESLYDIAGPPNADSADVGSVINFYIAQQWASGIYNHGIEDRDRPAKQKLSELLSDMESGLPELINYKYKDFSGHTVVGYGVEQGHWEFEGKSYSQRVLIYDCNAVLFNDDYCLYCEPSDGSLCVPAYINEGKIWLANCTNDLSKINYYDYYGNPRTADSQDENAYAILDCGHVTGEVTIEKIRKKGTVEAADDLIQLPVFGGKEVLGNIMYALPDKSSGYRISVSKPQELHMYLEYEDSLLAADTSAGSVVDFYPDHHMTIAGSDMEYTAEIVLDKETDCLSDWHTIAVSGTSDGEVQLEKTDDGFVLSSSNLNDIHVSFENKSDKAEMQLSTDCQKVLFYEIDDQTVGAAVDADHNGTFEKMIAQVTRDDAERGDVTGDGVINAKDANAILIAAAKIGTGKASGLTAELEKAADVNVDGNINAKDANAILRYAAAVGTGQKDSITDFI